MEETPEGRLAIIAHELSEGFADEYRATRTGPQRPDVADYRSAFELYVRKEILEAELKVLERYGTYPEAIDKHVKLNDINFKIAQRQHPDL